MNPVLFKHPDRDRIASIMSMVRSAALAEMDKDKWSVFGTSPKDYRDDAMNLKDSPFLPRFDFESNHSYAERLIFMTNYGYTQMVSDAYGSLFSEAHIEIDTSFPGRENEMVMDNFDGQGTGIKEFAENLFTELLMSGRLPVVTDRNGDVFTYYIPRENMRNWAGSFKFLTWDATREVVDGISVDRYPVVCVYTDSYYQEWRVFKGDKAPELLVNEPHEIGEVPIVDAWLGDGSPVLKPLAVMDFNLMNLDSEMRRILRNQAGLNILQVIKGAFKKLTDKSLIEIDPGMNGDLNKWITYPSGSMDSQFRYMEAVQKTIFEISRLRRQKNMAETDEAKKLDFVNTKAVLVQGAKAVEDAIRRSLKIRAKLLGIQSPRVTFEIDKNFEFKTLTEKLDEILRLIAASYPSGIIEHFQKKVIKESGMSEQDIEQAYNSEPDTMSEENLSEVVNEI